MAEVILITILVVLLFYIFFVRPARSEQRRRRRDLNALRVGDEILTTGGFIATVDAVETPPDGPMVLYLRLGDAFVVRARSSAVAELIRSVDTIDRAAPDLERDFSASAPGPSSRDSLP